MPQQLLQPHPLLLPNVVANILQNFGDIKFLSELRYVCHCWNEEVCCLLRRLKTVKFTSEKSLESYQNIYQDTLNTFGVFPHAKYIFMLMRYEQKIESVLTQENDSIPSPLISNFFEMFGTNITSVHLPIRSGCGEPLVLDKILCKVPNLEILGLNIQYFRDHVNNAFQFSPEAANNLRMVHTLNIQVDGLDFLEESAKQLIFLLLANMPNLHKLSYPIGDIRRISKVGLFLRDVILDLDPTVASKTLTRFGEWDFKTRLLEDDAFKLLCTNFPMRALHIDLWNPEDDFACISSELMAGLLRKWNKSLEKLSLEFPWRKEISFQFHFPLVMENLTFLYLGGLERSLLILLKSLPRLRRLELSQLELFTILPKPEGEEFPSVEQLRLDFCTGQSGGIMSRFSRIFPELRNLNINHTTNEAARVIFQKMKKLVKLRMHGNDLTDAGLCGFSESALNENNFLSMSPTEGKSLKKYPSISDLSELQYLKLDAYGLTEITVRHGLVHCTSLRIVKLDCTGGGSGSDSATTCRTFKLAEYGKHLVEESKHAVVEMKEDPPLENEALEFFQSHEKYSKSNDFT